MKIEVIEADLINVQHGQAILALLDEYAIDPAGGGRGVSDYVKTNLIAALEDRDDAICVLAFLNETPVGLVICFEGFSTFNCKPLLNIHDLVVSMSYRGQGIAKQMLRRIEEIAFARGCCKLTLEVLEGNRLAQALYQKFGFDAYELDPRMGKALFWEKCIGP